MAVIGASRSMPTQKARSPLAVTTAAFTVSSVRRSRHTLRNSCCIVWSNAWSTLGRSRVTTSTFPRRSTCSVSYDLALSSLTRFPVRRVVPASSVTPRDTTRPTRPNSFEGYPARSAGYPSKEPVRGPGQ